MSAGYVYILVNHSMPGLIKIGRTSRDSRSRAIELSTTGVPTPFEVAFELFSQDSGSLERQVHEELALFRVAANREFFRYPLDRAISLVIKLGGVSNDMDDSYAAEDILHRLRLKYPTYLDPTIVAVRIVQTRERVWLEVMREEVVAGYLKDQVIRRTDLGFITGGITAKDLYFPPHASVSENARRFVEEFDAYSIINTTDLFLDEAWQDIAKLEGKT